ncbi:MAG: hypothetical protein ACYDEO_29140 [Aggregatilineales bacterium]
MTETIKFWVKKGVLLDEKFSLRQAARLVRFNQIGGPRRGQPVHDHTVTVR